MQILGRSASSGPDRLSTEDEFFLHVEDTGVAQNVGGLVVLGPGPTGPPTLDDVRALVEQELPSFRRWRSHLVQFHGRPAWTPAADIDLSRHITQETVTTEDELLRAASRLVGTALPRDSPMWRIVLFPGLTGGRSGFLVYLNHCMADGIGGVAQLLNLVRPRSPLVLPQTAGPGRARTAAAVIAGLAALATDGRPSARLPAGGSASRHGVFDLNLDDVRACAKAYDVRVTELLLAGVGAAVAQVSPQLADRCDGRLRLSVPVMVRTPDTSVDGNVTAAVMLDVPARSAPARELVAQLRRHSAPLHSPSRALASGWVMSTALRVLPKTARRWFATTVYGPNFFHGIVSNLPGPAFTATLAGAPMEQVFPLVPPAPGAPVTVAALSWAGRLGVTVGADPTVLDATVLAARLHRWLDDAIADASTSAEIPGLAPGQGE